MSKLFRILLGVLAFIIVVPLLLVGAFLVTFDAGSFKKEITQQASKAIGREIALDGPIGVSLENGLSLSVKDVRIGNPDTFKEKNFIKAGKISLALNWQALADHRIDIRQFVVEDADVNLVTNQAGENNWDIKMPKAAEGAAPAAAQPAKAEKPAAAGETKEASNDGIKPSFKIERVDLNSIELVKTNLLQMDERKGKRQSLAIDHATIKAPVAGALNVGVRGKYNNTAFTLELLVPAGLQALVQGKPTQIDLKADYAGDSFALKALYAHSPKEQEFKNLQARVKNIDFSGNLNLRLDGEVPMITGALSAPEVDMHGLAPTPRVARASIHSLVMVDVPKAMLIAAPTTAADFRVMKAINTDVNLVIKKLILSDGKMLEDIKTRLLLAAGRLRLDPINATFQNVAYKGLLDFNPQEATPVTHLVLNGENINFTELASALGSKSPLSANGDLSLDITGQGLTPDSFKNTLSGKIEMTAGKGAVDLGGSGQAGINLIKMLYPKMQASDKQNINCGVVRFSADNGVLRANGILFDSPLAAVAGEGTVDLVHDNANLLFRHAVKDNQAGGFLNLPVRATGPVANLAFMPEEKAVVEKVSGILNGGGSSSSGVPKVDMNAKGNPCLAAVNNPNPVMLEQMKPQDAVKATVNQAKDLIKNIKTPDDAVNKLKGLFGH